MLASVLTVGIEVDVEVDIHVDVNGTGSHVL